MDNKESLHALIDKLKSKREELGISMDDLAKMVGVNRSTIWKLENKLHNPSFLLVADIASSLKVKIFNF
jgi:DNA-binding XRE family transcriptional regulator